MPAYSQRKRKSAKKSTRRSRRRLSRRIKTRRGGGGMKIAELKSSFEQYLKDNRGPNSVYFAVNVTAGNFFDEFNDYITGIITAHNANQMQQRNELLGELITKLDNADDSDSNQIFINFLKNKFKFNY
jgi:hypothetical protein